MNSHVFQRQSSDTFKVISTPELRCLKSCFNARAQMSFKLFNARAQMSLNAFEHQSSDVFRFLLTAECRS